MTMNTPLPADHAVRMARAALALDGLSVGDALGETCFRDENFEAILDDPHATAKAPWPWTDDTAMALGIYEVLDEHGRIDQHALARRFAARFRAQPFRGYGPGAIRLLDQIDNGEPWRTATAMIFPGGSFGNGSAMRIAPLSGYFAEDDYAAITEQARLSAEVTHAHPEGIAGGIAAAIAGAYAWKHRDCRGEVATKRGMFDVVLAHTPESEVLEKCRWAASLESNTSIASIARQLGNGSRISCQDTVPFCVWAAARYLDDYQSAIVNTIRVGGDIDTNCAIVGGIVALATGRDAIPADWLRDREELVV
jgi:ADP-ribosylglycohydrolase